MSANKQTAQNALLPLFIIVMVNYFAQIPYDIHLYHGRFNPFGTALLAFTFLWFLSGFFLVKKRKSLGYWILLAFLIVQVVFYFQNEIILMFYGYGLYWHLFHVKDVILWFTFFVGDVNFFAACYYSYYLIKKKALFF